MLQCDSRHNLLYAYGNKFRDVIPDHYEKSPDKLSYDEYFNKGIWDDIKEVFMPALKVMLGMEPESPELYIEDGRMEPYTHYNGDKELVYRVKFGSYRSGGKSEYITIFKVPVMDDYGVLRKEGKDFCILKLLEQDTVISYEADKKKLKLKFPRGEISIKAGKSEPIINISRFKQSSGQKNFSAVSTLFALCEVSGVDAVELYKKFKGFQLSNRYGDIEMDDSELVKGIDWLGGNVNSINASDYLTTVIPALQSDQYDMMCIRDALNQLLSLDRALGKMLDESVHLKNGYTIPIGTVVTRPILNMMKADRVTHVYVKNIPEMMGYYTDMIIPMPRLRKGTQILDCLRPYLPNESGMYLTKDTTFENLPGGCLVIPIGTRVCEGFMEMLAYNGLPEVRLTMNPNSSKGSRLVSFRYDIVTNNHHYENGEWIYVDDAGNVLPCQQYMTPHDIAALLSITQRLFVGADLEYVNNSDVGFRKRVVMPGELAQRAFQWSTSVFVKTMKYKFREMWNGEKYMDFFIDDAISNQFYGLSANWWQALRKQYKVLEYINVNDNTNPLSFISALTRIVTYVKDKHSISEAMHGISLTQFGKIDTYEVPQSNKIGVVQNLASGVVIRGDMMYSKYYRVIHVGNDSYVDDSQVYELSSEDEEKYRLGDITSLTLDSKNRIINKKRVFARVPELTGVSKQTVNYVDPSLLDYVNVTPSQYMSWATSVIPFMGSDDSVRVNFGVAQNKQSKGLVNPDISHVITTSNLIIPKLNTRFHIMAEKDGIVVGAFAEEVAVLYDGDTAPTVYEYTQVESALYSCTVRTLTVKEGDRVKKGQCLMTSNFVKDDVLAMGKNALAVFMPNGYNYEDGTYVSTRLCNALTSYRVNHGTWENEERFRSVRVEDIDKLHWCNEDRPVFKIKGYRNSKAASYRNVYPENVKGFLYDVQPVTGKRRGGAEFTKEIKYTTVSIDAVTSGDKLTNRHGNKGVVPRKLVKFLDTDESQFLLNNSEMPRIPNGEFADIVYNPLGTVSRMNIGQVWEIHLSIPMHLLGYSCVTDAFNGITPEEVQTLLSFVYDLANTDDWDQVFPKYPDVPKELHERAKVREKYIRRWKGTFDREGCTYIINPKNDGKQTETKVLMGWVYVQKLIQESDKKIHARGGLPGGEPYLEVSAAPTKSASKRGGQRLGTMEMDALCAYGASNLVQELLNERGDNPVARNNMAAAFLHRYEGYQIPMETAWRRSTFKFLSVMAALGVHIESDNYELPDLSYDAQENYFTYSQEALLTAKETDIEAFGSATEEEAQNAVMSKIEKKKQKLREAFRRG